MAAARKAAFLVPPTKPNQVWQLDFSDFETIRGGTWRIAGCRDYVSKFEPPWHISPTANHRDAIEAVELGQADVKQFGEVPSRVDTRQGVARVRCYSELRPVSWNSVAVVAA